MKQEALYPNKNRRIKSASIRIIQENEATGKVKEIYAEIMDTLGIDFVPNMYKAMAINPHYLESIWNKIQKVMGASDMLTPLTKDIVAYVVSVMSGCDYCIEVYTAALRHNALDDKTIMEILAMIDLYSGLNKLNIGLQTQPDEKSWYGCAG